MPVPTPENPGKTTLPAFTVRVGIHGAVFKAPASISLLAAAEQAGLKLRDSSCRNGTCRTCICRLVSGQVVYRIDWPGLSLDEKREGFILPCVAHPASDLVIDIAR